MAAPLLITINLVFVLSSRPWARASLSFKFKIKSDPGFRFPISTFPSFIFSSHLCVTSRPSRLTT